MGFFSRTQNVLDSLSADTKSGEPSWALVTGATSGIGWDLSRELCRQGFNIIIHGRNASRLNKLCELLREEYGVRAEPLHLDASTAFTTQSEASTRQKVDSFNIKLLVNNVGTGHAVELLKPFEQQSTHEITRILNVNVTFMTLLTQALIPLLKKHATATSPSIIINAGSLADIGLPYLSVYSGTKAYIRAYSRALDVELSAEHSNIRVVASIVGDTDSDGHRVGVNVTTPSSQDMARMIIKSAAKSAGGAVVPYIVHSLQERLCNLQPYWLLKVGLIAYFKPLLAKYANDNRGRIATSHT
jgi:17beta-estradiol 17-dehydrogenase / very-long-chain 3-oxoacyl-CoA reductase